MAMTKSAKAVKEFLPASYKLQLEKEAEAAEERSKFSDGPGRYLKAPQETTDAKGRKVPGTCEFRVMSPTAVWGFQLWYTNEEGQKRCQRWSADELVSRGIQAGQIPQDELPPNPETYEKSGKPKIQKFISVVVYNIGEDTFQIFDMVPDKMQKQFSATCNNPKWGSPLEYDFLWTRTGEGFQTVHTLQPQPHYEVPDEIQARFDALDVNLEAHVSGAPIDQVWGDIEAKTED